MVSDIKVDFTVIKAVLFKVIDENVALFSYDKEEILQVLYKHYEPKNNIDVAHLERYTKIFADYFGEQCRNIAKYHSDNVNTHNKQQIVVMENNGKLFKSGIFNTIKKHLYLEKRLLNANNQTAISIITILSNHLGNSYYFETKDEDLEKLFYYALLLYLSEGNCSELKDAEIIGVVKSMNCLLELHNLKFEIKQGDICLDNDSINFLQFKIEDSIKHIGGIAFLKFLFENEISSKYNKLTDRFLLQRDMKSLVMNVKNIRVPYNYLIQLAVKHLDKCKCPLLTELGLYSKYKEVINLSSNYLNVLDLQPYSTFKNMVWSYENIPVKLCQNILFEKMFTPVQYRPDFVIRFIKNVYEPFFDDSKCIGYTFSEYLKFCEVILDENRICVEYTFEELKKETRIKHTVLKAILDDVSIPYNEVNADYNHFLAKTNYRLKPLVKLQNNKYFLFSKHYNGFAFCEVLYQKLSPYYIGKFNRLKGEHLETMVKNLFKEKGFCFHSGTYHVNNSQNLECDLILEDDKRIIFIEIKNQPLLDGFELGDDVETLHYLGEGMIKAQKQCFRHIKHLKSNKRLVINEENGTKYELTAKGRQMICISICSQEYLFLSNKSFSEPFLESLLVATYHATDPSREARLNNINALRDELEQLVIDIYGTGNVRSKKAFFNTLFRSVQQIFTILTVSQTLDDFIYYLTQPISIDDGSGDVYHQLLTSMEIKRW